MNRMIRSSLAIVLAVASPQAATEALPESRTRAIDEFVGQFVDFAMFDGSVLVDIGGDTVRDDETRVFTWAMLSGEEAYTSTYTPIPD